VVPTYSVLIRTWLANGLVTQRFWGAGDGCARMAVDAASDLRGPEVATTGSFGKTSQCPISGFRRYVQEISALSAILCSVEW
jgi:hypothetical protein